MERRNGEPPLTRRELWLFRLGTPVAVALVTLLLLEAGSYAFGTFEGSVQPLQVGKIRIYGQHDPLLFWSLRPYARSPDGTRWINGQGLRGPELGPKQPDEFRILSLGESSTFAGQMRYEQSYSAVLEALLQSGPGRDDTRVVNAGVPGYSLFQGVHFLIHRSPELEPDLVLLYFGYNDFLPVTYLAERAGDAGPSAEGLNDWELFEHRQTLRSRVLGFLVEHSNLFRGVVRAKSERTGEARTHFGRRRVPAAHRERLLELALDHCRARGIDLVVIVPIYRSFDDHESLLRDFTRAREVPAVDLPATLPARFERPRAAYFLDAAHPTPEAHRLIAEAIHDVVAPLVPRARE